MSFDFRPQWGPLHDVGQVNEGGYNRFNACIPTTVHEIMEALTGVHIPPQAFTDFEAGPTFKGYTQLGWSVDFVQKHYPNPPVMSIINPDDTFAYVNEMGARGWPMALLFHIDGSVTIGSQGSGYHCSPPLASDGVDWIVVRNIWREGWMQEFTKAEFNAACSGTNAGTGIVFHAAVPQGGDLTSQEADAIRRETGGALSRIAWHAIYGHNVDTPDHDNIAQACVDKGVDGGIMGWLDSPDNVALQQADAARLSLNQKGGA